MDVYKRLTPKGKRRALIAWGVETLIYSALLFGAGYVLCLGVYGLQFLCGVA